MTDFIRLPQTPDGGTYVTDQMRREHPQVWAYWYDTQNSWYRVETAEIHVMYPSIPRYPRFINSKGEEVRLDG